MAGPSSLAAPEFARSAVGGGFSTRGGAALYSKDPRAARQAAQEFEAMFLSQMLGHMFDGVKTDGLFGGGDAEHMYRSLLIDEYGKSMSRTGGVGIADSLMREIMRNQESVKP